MKPSSPSVLPASVLERLGAEKSRLDAGAFTSSFGVGELLLAQRSGYDSLGQVMGAAVYQIGAQWTNPNWSDSARKKAQTEGVAMELTTMTAAFANARQVALERLQTEASLLGATGVVGIDLRISTDPFSGEDAKKNNHEHRPNQLEFVAIGTAVKSRDFKHPGGPFLSNLSGAELWQLAQAGYAPCGLVCGNCSYYQALAWKTQQSLSYSYFGKGARNFEIAEYTDALYSARELAVERLYQQARSNGAKGVVGVSVSFDNRSSAPVTSSNTVATAGFAFSFLAIGTAIRSSGKSQKTELSSVINLHQP